MFFTFWVSQLETDPNPCSEICVPDIFHLIVIFKSGVFECFIS